MTPLDLICMLLNLNDVMIHKERLTRISQWEAGGMFYSVYFPFKDSAPATGSTAPSAASSPSLRSTKGKTFWQLFYVTL